MSDHEVLKERYRVEIGLAIVSAVATVLIRFYDSPDIGAAFIVDAVVATLLICVGSIKAHASRVA
ncbi:MAG TPA: hypothetical protein VGG72_07595 [Bryobacteraceae bacterium]|jgi:hypothetical protein